MMSSLYYKMMSSLYYTIMSLIQCHSYTIHCWQEWKKFLKTWCKRANHQHRTTWVWPWVPMTWRWCFKQCHECWQCLKHATKLIVLTTLDMQGVHICAAATINVTILQSGSHTLRSTQRMYSVLILAAIPLLIRTTVFAQCQGGTEGKLNQWKNCRSREPTCVVNHVHVVAAVNSNTVAYFPESTTWDRLVAKTPNLST